MSVSRRTVLVTDITAWLGEEIARQVQAMVTRVEAHCRASGTRPITDIAVLGSTITHLAQWLPTQHATRTVLQKLDKLLPALLQTQDAAPRARLLQWLYGVNQQLQPAPATVAAMLWLKQKPAINAGERGLSQLATWLRQWQIAVRGDTALPATSPRQALLDLRQSLLLRQLVDQWRAGTLTPGRLGKLLQRLRCLLQLASTRSSLPCFDALALRLCLMQVYPVLHAESVQLQCWEALHELLQRGECKIAVPAACDDIAMLQAVQTDLRHYLPRLRHYLQQATTTPAALPLEIMTLHYKLPWLLEVAGQRALAQLYHAWYQALLLCWKHRQPLPPDLAALLMKTTDALPLAQWQGCDLAQVLSWQLQLMQLWPTVPDTSVQQVALQSMATPAPLVELTAIPVLLSRSFSHLSSAVAAWFTSAEALCPYRVALQEELLLLEKGAAAVRIHEVEIFSSQLLALHQRVAMQVQEFPAALLWRSHQHLQSLLDEAAAWQPPQLDVALVADIRHFLQQSQGNYHALMVREPSPVPLHSVGELLQRLHDFVDAIAVLLDQPARLETCVESSLPLDTLLRCEQALRPLLLALMLEQAHAADQRREALRPRATIITLTLNATDKGVWADVTDEGEDSISSDHTLKRLRTRLPAQVQQLTGYAVTGVGRRFRFLIAS